MDVDTVLNEKLVCFPDLKLKKENLELLIRMIENESLISDVKALRDSIFSREELMSTGIGLGIAIPHVRLKGLEEIIIAIGINKKGIIDYDSLDGKPVKIVIMIIAGEKQHREYLMMLAQIVKILKKDEMINRLLKAKSSSEVVGLLAHNFKNSD